MYLGVCTSSVLKRALKVCSAADETCYLPPPLFLAVLCISPCVLQIYLSVCTSSVSRRALKVCSAADGCYPPPPPPPGGSTRGRLHPRVVVAARWGSSHLWGSPMHVRSHRCLTHTVRSVCCSNLRSLWHGSRSVLQGVEERGEAI